MPRESKEKLFLALDEPAQCGISRSEALCNLPCIPKRSHLPFPWLSPGLLAIFYLLLVLSLTEPFKFFVSVWSLHGAREKQKEGKQAGPNLNTREDRCSSSLSTSENMKLACSHTLFCFPSILCDFCLQSIIFAARFFFSF